MNSFIWFRQLSNCKRIRMEMYGIRGLCEKYVLAKTENLVPWCYCFGKFLYPECFPDSNTLCTGCVKKQIHCDLAELLPLTVCIYYYYYYFMYPSDQSVGPVDGQADREDDGRAQTVDHRPRVAAAPQWCQLQVCGRWSTKWAGDLRRNLIVDVRCIANRSAFNMNGGNRWSMNFARQKCVSREYDVVLKNLELDLISMIWR